MNVQNLYMNVQNEQQSLCKESTVKVQPTQEINNCQPGISKIVEGLLLQNEELLCDIAIESKCRKNKNIITAKMSTLIHKLQRNLIRLAKLVPPTCMADSQHVEKEKQRFLSFYHKRNSKKPTVLTNKGN